MIRLATFGVALIAGLLAIGAFLLARGGDAPPVSMAQAPTEQAPPEATVMEPQVEKLYFLRDIDLSFGEIAIILYHAGPDGGDLVVRDPAAIGAAKDAAYVNTHLTGGQALGSLVLATLGAPPFETVIEIYRDDVLIGSVQCASTACGPHASDPDIDDAGLRAAAIPLIKVDDQFDSYDDYLATIDAIASDPNFMLLNARIETAFPEPRRQPTLTVRLPTVVSATDDAFDTQAHETKVRDALTPLLPEGARIDQVTIAPQGFAVLGDKDNNRPVVMDDAEIPFLEARYFSVQVQIIGTASLPASAYDTLTAATLDKHDVDADFSTFVTSALNTSCVDCYFLKVDGDYSGTAMAIDQRAEHYTLSYYDLREAP